MKQGAKNKALKQKTLCGLRSAVRGERSEQAIQVRADHGELTLEGLKELQLNLFSTF
jgi:hypothetical protein